MGTLSQVLFVAGVVVLILALINLSLWYAIIGVLLILASRL